MYVPKSSTRIGPQNFKKAPCKDEISLYYMEIAGEYEVDYLVDELILVMYMIYHNEMHWP
jgi:hypothetical protein